MLIFLLKILKLVLCPIVIISLLCTMGILFFIFQLSAEIQLFCSILNTKLFEKYAKSVLYYQKSIISQPYYNHCYDGLFPSFIRDNNSFVYERIPL